VRQERPFNKAMLTSTNHIVLIQESSNIFLDYRFHYFTRNGGKRNWPVVTWIGSVTFLKGDSLGTVRTWVVSSQLSGALDGTVHVL